MGVLFAFATALVVVIFIFLNICRIKRLRLEEGASDRPSGHWAFNGLEPSVLETFPVFKYSEVAANRAGTDPLECAVCLSLFEEDDDEELRLLPKCNHVFHVNCVDSWFKHHSTCPLCRTDLKLVSHEFTQPDSVQQVFVLAGREGVQANDCNALDVWGDIEEGQVGKCKRWKSMGHVAEFEPVDKECWKRFTLHLPEEMLRKKIGEEKGKYKRTRNSF